MSAAPERAGRRGLLARLLGHSVVYALGPQIPRLAGIFVLPITTQFLTPTDYGVAGIVSAYAGALSGFRDLGLVVVLANTYYGQPRHWRLIWRRLHGLLTIWSVGFALTLGGLLFAVLPDEVGSSRGAVVALSVLPLALFEPTVLLGSRFLQFEQRPLYMSAVTAAVGVATVALNLLFIAYFRLGFIGWFLSSAVGSLLAFVLYLHPTYVGARVLPVFRLRWRFVREHLRVGLPLVPHNYSSYLLSGAERFVMDRVDVPVDRIGQYNAAAVFGNYFNLVATAAGMAVGPQMTRLYAVGTDAALRACRDLVLLLQGMFLVGTFAVALWAKEIVFALLQNEDLRVAYAVAGVAIMSHASRPMYWAVVNRLAFAKRTGQLWKLSFGAGLMNVLLNLIAIPLWGPFAAAGATFVAQLLLGFAGFFMPEYRNLETRSHHPAPVALAIVGATLLAFVAQDLGIAPKLAITFGVVVLLAAVGRRVQRLVAGVEAQG